MYRTYETQKKFFGKIWDPNLLVWAQITYQGNHQMSNSLFFSFFLQLKKIFNSLITTKFAKKKLSFISELKRGYSDMCHRRPTLSSPHLRPPPVHRGQICCHLFCCHVTYVSIPSNHDYLIFFFLNHDFSFILNLYAKLKP